MPCLPAWKKKLLIAKRDRLTTQLESIEIVIDNAIATGTISNYELDTGQGKQKVTYRNINELTKARSALELELARVMNKLCCRGVVNLGLRRYNGNNRCI